MPAPPLPEPAQATAFACFAPCAPGLEQVLAEELEALGLPDRRQASGGCFFSATLPQLYDGLLWLRTASRLLRIVGRYPCTSEAELYQGANALPWETWLRPDQTFAVRVRLNRSPLPSAANAALRIKDALVDRIRGAKGMRPNVDKRAPQIPVQAWLEDGQCTIALDAAGSPLFMRGYRATAGEAPLKETLAAGLVLMTGWRGETPFYDFLCGSGTLAIEAALIAGKRAPGLLRDEFAVRHWPEHDERLWRDARRAARGAAVPIPIALYAADRDRAAITDALRNASRAGVGGAITIVERKASTFRPEPGPGLILLNPPYGERLSEETSLLTFYKSLGDVLKQHCAGKQAWIFTRPGPLLKAVGLRPAKRYTLFNGALECRLAHFPLFAGSGKGPSAAPRAEADTA